LEEKGPTTLVTVGDVRVVRGFKGSIFVRHLLPWLYVGEGTNQVGKGHLCEQKGREREEEEGRGRKREKKGQSSGRLEMEIKHMLRNANLGSCELTEVQGRSV